MAFSKTNKQTKTWVLWPFTTKTKEVKWYYLWRHPLFPLTCPCPKVSFLKSLRLLVDNLSIHFVLAMRLANERVGIMETVYFLGSHMQMWEIPIFPITVIPLAVLSQRGFLDGAWSTFEKDQWDGSSGQRITNVAEILSTSLSFSLAVNRYLWKVNINDGL